MPITVNLPNGSKAVFPDGTTPDVMKAAIQKKFPPTGGAPTGPAQPPAGLVPGSREYAQWAIDQAKAGNQLPQVSKTEPSNTSLVDQVLAGYTGAVDSIPVAGGYAKSGLERLKAAMHGVDPKLVASEDAAREQANPTAATIGRVAGTVLPFVAGGEIPMVAKALGMDAGVPLLARTLAAAGSNAALSGADTLTRGGSLQDAGESALIGGTIGAALPGAGALLSKGVGAATSQLSKITGALRNPAQAAQKMVAGTAANDIRTGAPVMMPADEAASALNGQPILNADRFGEGTRTLARTATNSNPAAGEALRSATQDRFLTQGSRATNFIKRVAPGIDDLGALDQLQNAARSSNRVAYDAAYSHPSAHVVWTPEIKQLFQSPDFINAVRDAGRTGANDAALAGQKAVTNPFVWDAKGNIALRKMKDGSVALPSLQFWDIVQRNLRQSSEKAFRDGEKLYGSQLSQMRQQLVGSLDQAVPQFGKARAGAAAAFGAEDALDAGKKFVTQRMGLPEAQRAHARLTPPERKLFATGFASELIDKVNAASDRVNVINQVFASPASRAQVELALGKDAANELEQFMRVEDIMQATKNAVQGNSSTAKQLIAAGLVGGGLGGALGGWDPRNVASGALLLGMGRAGMRSLGKAVDQRVMEQVAEILASGDPKSINRQILNATLSPKHADAIKAIQAGIAATARGGSVALPRAMVN